MKKSKKNNETRNMGGKEEAKGKERNYKIVSCVFFFFSSRRRHTRSGRVTGVQTCALPICSIKSGALPQGDPGSKIFMALVASIKSRGAAANKIGRASGRERV